MTRTERSLAVLAVLAVSVLTACGASNKHEPEPGAELYAVSADHVTEVLFSSQEQKIYAFRWKTDERFRIIAASPGSPLAEQCVAGRGFEEWLNAVTSMRINRETKPLSASDSNRGWAVLTLRDTTNLEVIEVRLHVPPSGDGFPVISSGDKQFSVDVSSQVLRNALAGCRSLAK
jgi:hypothetical protein